MLESAAPASDWRIHVRTVLAVAGLVGVIASVPGHAQVTKGALGPVEALGQERPRVGRRRPARHPG